jgi:hypothetical protein
MGYRNNNYPEPCPDKQKQRHVHEVQGAVKIAGSDPHTHRFCTVTEEAIPYGVNDHIHEVCFRTDFYEDHYHEFKGKTGCAIQVGDRHVHFIESVTSVDDGHRHAFEAATFIENPTGDNHRKDDCLNHEEHHKERYRRY